VLHEVYLFGDKFKNSSNLQNSTLYNERHWVMIGL